MPVCDCCRRDKPDVKIRVGLRGVDNRGKNTARPFHGPLCNDCLARTGRFGSAEQRWLLHQIMLASALKPQWRSPDVERSYHSVLFGLTRWGISRNRMG